MIDSLVKKYVSAFGFLFTGIEVRDWNEETNTWNKEIKVPVSYGPKEDHLVRMELREKTHSVNRIAMTMPRIAFEQTGFSYDPSRVNNKMNYYVNEVSGNGNSVEKIYAGIPYNINFEVYILVKYAEHGTQIVEQILPFFNPHFNLKLKVTGRQNIVIDTPIILNSVSTNDTYESSFTMRRAVTWTLSFTMKAMMFNGLGDEGVGSGSSLERPIIKKAIDNVGMIDDFGNKNNTLKMTTIPVVVGKTLDEIAASDDWNDLTTIEENI